MTRYLKEPLLHFLIAGALLFGAYAWLNPASRGTDAQSRQVRIGPGEVRWLTETWMLQWHRPPTTEEMRGMVLDLLKEELYSREAREMRLDKDDIIVRRRLTQKLEFLLQDTARAAEPTDDDLRRFYQAHPKRFRTEARISFRQVYFSPEHRRDAVRDAGVLLARLSSATPPSVAAMGDRLLLDSEYRDADEQTVVSAFGPDFADAVFAQQPGAWHGPIASGYGLHLVYVTQTVPAHQRAFAEARPQVLEAWREQQQRESEERYFARLMKKYHVVVDDSVKPLIAPLGVAQVDGAAR